MNAKIEPRAFPVEIQDRETLRAKYAHTRPSVPLGSECLIRAFYLDSLDQPQQLVLASTVLVERIKDRKLEIRHALEAFLCTLGFQPLSIQLEVFTTEFMPFEEAQPRGQVLEFPVRR